MSVTVTQFDPLFIVLHTVKDTVTYVTAQNVSLIIILKLKRFHCAFKDHYYTGCAVLSLLNHLYLYVSISE